MVWILRYGRRIRVDLYTDPCWNSRDKWTLYTTYAKFISEGVSEERSESLAAAAVWKQKWKVTFSDGVESRLENSAGGVKFKPTSTT